MSAENRTGQLSCAGVSSPCWRMKFPLESGFPEPPAMISPVTGPLRIELLFHLITRAALSIRPLHLSGKESSLFIKSKAWAKPCLHPGIYRISGYRDIGYQAGKRVNDS